ncbi:NADH dehydrogenase [ubiquinone] 1 beta subcomplex subunit 5, mitochondrial-like [Haliotis rubra]|uniref:NADH dehydrogenase [ubiquinone] 1 beta subcomplex subunit 5, mitochondrial-like n=1 Tax=Haliotis rubra TaxID=36100 RepID=UPI001EE5F58A|nr:NADH dehydrogenase [ubiquinone] 1 beta subcomplex subunit 5, mitochondrial-like [Haliotis rubra]
MVVLSVLRPSMQGGRSLFLRACTRAQLLANTSKTPTTVVVRQMGDHKKTLEVVPSRFEWERWKDDMHFFIVIGMVPMLALIFYANVFIGPAELSDVPEDYEPKHWEYHKSPIVRFLAKHVYESPEQRYERTLHVLHDQNEKRKFKLLDQKVKDLMSSRQDYKGWYYVPMDKSRIDRAKEAAEYDRKLQGTR